MPDNDVYLGNPLLKKANTKIEFTQEQITEYIRCKDDPVYFKYLELLVNVDWFLDQQNVKGCCISSVVCSSCHSDINIRLLWNLNWK